VPASASDRACDRHPTGRAEILPVLHLTTALKILPVLRLRTALKVVLVLSLLVAVGAEGIMGQQTAEGHVVITEEKPRPEDVTTLDGIIQAFYDVISGPAGQPREWGRDRTLYLPGARFVMVQRQEGANAPQVKVVDHQQFVDLVNHFMVKEGFFEREIHRVTESFGAVTHVWSTYEWRTKPGGPVGGRGVNSIQLLNDGKRWWITAAMWDEEAPDNPLSPLFLP
jgi:hypothetical protein